MIKNGWTRVTFGDVVRQVRDQVNPEASGLERYVAGEHMETDDLRIRGWGVIGDGYLGPAFHMRFKPGHVLYGSRRTYLRKVAVAHFEGVTANTTFVLEPRDPRVLLPEFLPFIMQAESFHEHSIKQSKGSVNPYVNFSDLAWYEFDLPPREEQRRVVKTLACSDDYLEQCRLIQLRLGKVVTSLLNEMWKRFPLRQIQTLIDEGIIESPQDGNHGEKHPKASDYVKSGIPFVMASDLRDGLVDFDGCKKIPKAMANTLRIGFANVGDVLLSHKGTVGLVARLLNTPTNFVMLTPQVTYYRVRDEHALHRDWLFYAFTSPGFQQLLDQYGKQSTRAYVGITTQKQLSIPYCSVPEQLEFLEPLWSAERLMETTRKRVIHARYLRTTLFETAIASC